MEFYKLAFWTVSQQNGQPTLQLQRFITKRTDAKALQADFVATFAAGYENVRLLSSEAQDIDIDLTDTVLGLQNDDSVPGISQDTAARTAMIFVGAPERPLQKHSSAANTPGFATPQPGQAPPENYKKGRIRSLEHQKTSLRQQTAGQLFLKAANRMRVCMRLLCSRRTEAPWQFHAYEQQQLGGVVARAILQMLEAAEETHAKVVKATKK